MSKTKQKSFRFSPEVAKLLVKLSKRTRRSQTNVVEMALIEEAKRLKIPVIGL